MAKKRHWSRYRPPSEVRTEDGALRDSAPTRTKASARKAPARKAPVPKAAVTKATAGRRTGWWVAGVLVAIGAVIGIAAAVGGDGDDDSLSEIDTELLDEDFVARGLTLALEEEGAKPFLLQFNEYSLSLEYYEPEGNRIRTFETNGYVDGFQLQVEDNYYDDRPRPFDLAEVDAATIVTAVEEALAKAEEPYSFGLRIEAGATDGAVTVETRVSARDDVTVTTDLDGEVLSVEQ